MRQGKIPLEVISQEISSSLRDFVPGLVVQHKSFGEGVIAREEGNVIVVRFKDGSQCSFMKDIYAKQRLIWAI
ncbi:hypothetical protein [Desulfosporosinus sp.]|uniref:hypothetical protein n=1 Tax=Desulfosporosinus sp. TaxID=157907 RepID=UPI00232162FE|nr:hypothetical protein [Desulfosporosinus sp.]MCO5387535.1 hypothetical protein [Desulfosporosinus sp.]MDA8223124.1 hypothetical protein [Desulfitobacterium hafniense]